jgi:hypothetical protein
VSSIAPHDGCGGATPRPRKLSAASTRTALANVSVNCTVTAAIEFGRMWSSRILGTPAPAAMAPCTKSCDLSDSVLARIRRANSGICITPIAIIALTRLGPSTAMMASARMMAGNANIMSIVRISSESSQPPK